VAYQLLPERVAANQVAEKFSAASNEKNGRALNSTDKPVGKCVGIEWNFANRWKGAPGWRNLIGRFPSLTGRQMNPRPRSNHHLSPRN
jgi:hypothetical protein